MIKLIVGSKGSGKTKVLVDMIHEALKTTAGNVVVIEKSMQLTTQIPYAARLIDVDEYHISGADELYGFVAGVLAGNYDITELFMDGLLKIVEHNLDAAANVLDRIDKITGDSVVTAVTISCAENELPDSLRKYL